MKVAIVYDWINRRQGGAERVLANLHQIWPQAPLYTSVYDPQKARWARKFPKVVTSFVNDMPLARKRAFWFYPLIVLGFEQFDFDKFDLVISVTSGPAKAVITKPETTHICYCLTPPTRHIYNRRLWPFQLAAKQDYILGQRPDYYLTTCKNVSDRIEYYYQRNSKIVYPGIDLKKFKPKSRHCEDYYLVVSRLVKHKKVDLVIKAFNQNRLPLKIIGTGRNENKLKLIAKKNIDFIGEVSDNELVEHYQQCQAVIFPQEEDFGLVPIETQACGKPVIAFKGGGALETIIENKTGKFFYPQKPSALNDVIHKFEPKIYSSKTCRQNAESFSEDSFKIKFRKKVQGCVPAQP